MNDQNQNNQAPGESASFFSRVLDNDSAKKGAAAALAGVVVAIVQEALWPKT